MVRRVWAWTTRSGTTPCLLEEPRSAADVRGRAAVLSRPSNEQAKRFMSDEHFTVDGTLIQAWASQKSFKQEGRIGRERGRGRHQLPRTASAPTRRTNRPPTRTRGCTRRATAGSPNWPTWATRLVENRNGLIAAAMATQADGYGRARGCSADAGRSSNRAARGASPWARTRLTTRRTSWTPRERLNVTPHIAKNDTGRRSNMDGRTTRHAGYGDQPELPMAGREDRSAG